MPTAIDHAQLQRLLSDGAQLVEVLPRQEKDGLGLPDALNLPLKELGVERARHVDPRRAVLVHCWDAL